jgi:hypothetical protein
VPDGFSRLAWWSRWATLSASRSSLPAPVWSWTDLFYDATGRIYRAEVTCTNESLQSRDRKSDPMIPNSNVPS